MYGVSYLARSEDSQGSSQDCLFLLDCTQSLQIEWIITINCSAAAFYVFQLHFCFKTYDAFTFI